MADNSKKRGEARSKVFCANGLVCLFWGTGLSALFSFANIWFADLTFYGVNLTLFPIAVNAVGVLNLLAATTPSHGEIEFPKLNVAGSIPVSRSKTSTS